MTTFMTLISSCIILALCPTSGECRLDSNSDMGKFESASCPVALPEDSDLSKKFEFWYVTVPEQHAKPSGPMIQVAVARFKSISEDSRPDPLVLNTGGPGDSNLDLFIPLMGGSMGKAFLSQRDVVIIELRGLRYSKPALICEEVFEAQLGMLDKDIKGEEANQVLLNAMRVSYDRFTNENINISAFNNVETAADINLVMTTLGYDQFNILGASAGTIVAQHVMRDYPKRLRSVILNAAVPFGQPFFRDMLANGAHSLERMFRMCESDPACRAAYPNLEEDFFDYLEKLNKDPVTVPVKHPGTGEVVNFVLNGDRLSTWLFASMYFNTQIPASLKKLMDGDYSQLQKHIRIFFPMQRFSYGLTYTIFSTEYLDFDVEDTRVDGRYARFVDGTSLFFGPKLIAQASDFWKVMPLDQSLMKPVASDIPTLILNGELDHVLPASYTEEMASQLKNGYRYLFPGVAHSPIDAGPCAFTMILEFLNDPSKPPNSDCMQKFTHAFVIEK